MASEAAGGGDLPGFRRRFRATNGPGWAQCEFEDDYHRMVVTIAHEGGVATAVSSEMPRSPWTTCPGASLQLAQTFTGAALAQFPARGEKAANCTHLHDLALLAAAHAFDEAPLVYDVLVSDPVDGERHAEIRRDGVTLMHWVEARRRIVKPAEIAGKELMELRDWIKSLDPARQEAARMLRWAAIMSYGRGLPSGGLSDDPWRRPMGRCYTFSAGMVEKARPIGEVLDFSRGERELLTPRPTS
jgi:hypothetical protein